MRASVNTMRNLRTLSSRSVHQCTRTIKQSNQLQTVIYRSFSSTSSTPSTKSTPEDEGDAIADAINKIRPLVDLQSRSAPPEDNSTVIYTAPFIAACRTVKMFSLSSCLISLMSAPVMMVLAPSTIPPGGRISMGLVVASLGLGTTLALTAFTKPYVVRIYKHQPIDNSEPTFTIEQFNLLARPVYTTVPLSAFIPLHNRGFKNLRAVVADQKSGKDVNVDFFLHPEILMNDPDLAPLVEHSLPEGYHEQEEQRLREAAQNENTLSTESEKPEEDAKTKKAE